MRKHFLPILFLFILAVFTYSTWFFSNALLSWGDFHASFSETVKEFATFPIIWQPGNMFGSLFITLSFWPQLYIAGLLAHLHISAEIIERIIYFWPIPLLNVVSMYFLSYYIFRSRIAGFVSGVVYGFSAGTLSLVMGGIVTEGMAISLLPLLMLCFMLVLEKRKMLHVLLTGLLAFIIGFYEFRVLYLISWILFFYLIYYLIFESKITKRILIKITTLMGALGVIIILLNFYWLIGIQSVDAISSNVVFATSLWGQEFTNIATSITIFPYFWTGGKTASFTLEPILIHFWLIPIFAFLGLLYAKKNKKVLFFAFFALLGIFLTKQGAAPFPHVYQWLFDHLPGFNAFRYATVFSIYTQFAYSILIGAFICLLFKWSVTMKRKIIFCAAAVFIVSIFLINIKPLVTKEIGALSVGREFPSEYVALKNFILKDKNFYRILSIPSIQRFTFNNYIHPVAGFFSLPSALKSLNPKLLSIESIRYIILPSDPMHEIYGSISKQSFEKFINSNTASSDSANPIGIVFLKNIGEIKLWENTNFSPHIMPVNDLIYVTGDAQIKDIVDLPTSDRTSYFFENSISGEVNPAIIIARKGVMFNNATKIYSIPTCIRCDIRNQYYNYATFPYARFLPDSPLYPFIQQKEEKALKSNISNQQKVSLEVLFSEKRIVEINDMLNKKVNSRYIIQTISRNNELLDDIEKYFLSTTNTLDDNSNLLEIYDYLSLERKQISDFIHESSDPVASLLRSTIYRLDTDIERLSHIVWVTSGNDKKLIFSIPESGTYSVFVKNEPEVNMDKSTFFIDKKQIDLGKISGNFFEVKNLPLLKGNYPIEFKIDPINLLETTSSGIQLLSDTVNASTKIPIKTLQDFEGKYELSFDYKVEAGETPRIFLSDETKNYILDQKLSSPRDGQWHHFKAFFTPNLVSKEAYLNFWLSRQEDGTTSSVSIENLSMIKIVNPVIIFAKDTGRKFSTPKITYQEMNPTDYKIVVKNATDAFFLAFSEGFDENWKVYIEKDQSADDLKTKGQNTDVTASYFGGDVEEIEYADKADIGTILGTFKEENLPDYLHGQINGFGNGWLMPSGGLMPTGDYVVRIIYKPQRYVLIGTFITVISLVFILGGILFFGIKEIKRKNSVRKIRV